jgi:hypothetical protein
MANALSRMQERSKLAPLFSRLDMPFLTSTMRNIGKRGNDLRLLKPAFLAAISSVLPDVGAFGA